MSAKPSVFAKIRAAVLAFGQSERTATRKAWLLETASFSDFKRLSPEQNVRLGLSPKARRYVLKDAQRITKSTPAISARQFETKRARELFGVTPEKATQARRHGAISYVSADQRERVAKAAITARRTTSSRPSRSCEHRVRRCPAGHQTSDDTEPCIQCPSSPSAAIAP
jgi:hypothetical protein